MINTNEVYSQAFFDSCMAELAALKAERTELREALAQCVRRLDKLNQGGLDEPDPTVVKARAVLKQTETK